jgi:hypothetical protein
MYILSVGTRRRRIKTRFLNDSSSKFCSGIWILSDFGHFSFFLYHTRFLLLLRTILRNKERAAARLQKIPRGSIKKIPSRRRRKTRSGPNASRAGFVALVGERIKTTCPKADDSK